MTSRPSGAVTAVGSSFPGCTDVAGVALSLILQAQRARAQPDAKGMRLSVNRVPHSRAVAVSMQVEVDAPLVYVQRVLLEVPAYPDWIPRVQWVRVRATGSRWLLCESALNLPWPLEDVRETLTIGGGAGPDDTAEFMLQIGPAARALREASDPTLKPRVAAAVRDALLPYATPQGIRMGSASWIVTATP